MEQATVPNPSTQYELVFEDGTREIYAGGAMVERGLHTCTNVLIILAMIYYSLPYPQLY